MISGPGLEFLNDLPGTLLQVCRALKPDGLLLFHVTNYYLDLNPVLANIAAELDLAAVTIESLPPSDNEFYYSTYVALSRLTSLEGLYLTRPLRPSDIIQGGETSQGPSEVRYRAHVAFSTAYDLVSKMERIATRKPSREVFVKGADSSSRGANAAPCTTKSSAPNSCFTRANTASMSASDVTSHGSTSGDPPSPCDSSLTCSSNRPW